MASLPIFSILFLKWEFDGTEFLGSQVKVEGSEFNEWYGYLSDGLMLTEEDLKGPKLNNNVQLGDVKYKDISGPDGVPDGKISPEYDRVLLGGSLPRFQYGGSLNLGYKGFDFSLAFQGVGRQNARLSDRWYNLCLQIGETRLQLLMVTIGVKRIRKPRIHRPFIPV